MTYYDTQSDLKISVYTLPHCQQCEATKRVLDNAHIPYRVLAITDETLPLLQQAGFHEAPVIMVNNGTTLVDYWSGHKPQKLRALTHRQAA